MTKETIEILIEGGKATAGPPLGPQLGPLGVNIGQVVADINKKTSDFKGMQVPVKVVVNTETKEYTITIGTPPASSLIKKELGLKKAASNPTQPIADMNIDQLIKIAKMKEDTTLGKDIISTIKEIVGTANSMGVTIMGMRGKEFADKIEKYKEEILKKAKE